jgi:phage protein
MQIRYTDEEKAFLRSFIPGHQNNETRDAFIKKFGKCITTAQVRSFCRNNKVGNGMDTRFKKGNVPPNKGKKMSAEQYAKASRTMFKKGNISHNYRPVGSERVNVDGYIEIKVADPSKWELKHRVVWEESNGKIPAGMNLIFKDNNPLNTKLDNLMLVTRAENLEMNNIGAGACKGIEKEILLNSIRLKNAVKNKLSRAKE